MSKIVINPERIDYSLPLAGYLKDFAGTELARFCTPGHKGNFSNMRIDGIDLLQLDIADDVALLPHKIRESESIAARVFNTLRTHYLVNGSTAGVLTMFLSVLKPEDKIVMGRNCHLSALSGLVLSGGVPAYAPCEIASEGFQLNTTPEAVEKTLDLNPDAKAVFITSPSYWGICADVKGIAEVCRGRGVFLLVDEAWGAHFPFGEGFPPSAVSCGADLVVQSAHKTLPCLTGASLLHLCSSRIDPVMLEESLSLIQTTSPNLLFYVSLEQAIGRMKREGRAVLNRAAGITSDLRKMIRECRDTGNVISGFCPSDIYEIAESQGFETDPLKLALLVDPVETGISGSCLSRYLVDYYEIIPEMSDFNTILFLLTGWEREGHIQKLINALKHLINERNDPKCCYRMKEKQKSRIHPDASCYLPPITAVTPRAAHFFPKKQVDMNSSEGCICGVPVVPYPPGIPMLMPGEIINSEAINILENLVLAGINIKGLERNGSGWLITVLDN